MKKKSGLHALHVLGLILLGFNTCFAQTVSTPSITDRGRVKVLQIPDAMNANKKLWVLRTDNDEPLRGTSPWILDKNTSINNPEISMKFFQELRNQGLNSIRLIWFQAWFQGYAKQNNTPVNFGQVTDFTKPAEVEKCLAVLDSAVSRASRCGLYVNINFHSPWKGPVDTSYVKQFWTVVAPYFADRTHVLYETTNEPVPGSNTYLVNNDRGYDMKIQADLYTLCRNFAPNTFLIVLTPPSCEINFSGDLSFVRGVQRFESMLDTVDWTKTAVGYHSYYLGWVNGVAGKTSESLRIIHQNYPAMPTEVNFPVGILKAAYNNCPSMDGEIYQPQTLERLGLGWWMWAVSHPDNSDEGFYTNWKFLREDAIKKGYFWIDAQAFNLSASSVTSTSTVLNWTNGTGSKRVVFMKQSTSGTLLLKDSINYHADPEFGKGDQIGTDGWFCVFNGTGSTVQVSNLEALKDYVVLVCEYKGISGAEIYQKTTSTTNTISLSTMATGLNLKELNNPVFVFPNPANDFVNIDLGDNEKASISVVDMNGKIVLTTKLSSKVNKIFLRNLAKGAYTLQIETDQKCANTKLIVD
jgi:hypothetical protein